MKNSLSSIGKHYWQKKARFIIGIYALHMAVVLFILSIGMSLLRGVEYNLGFCKENVFIVMPRAGKYEETKEILKQNKAVEKVIEGTCEKVRSKVIFFSCGGTVFIKMSQEDLDFFVKNYDICLEAGKMPTGENEILAPLQSIYYAKGKIGQLIGEGVGENEMGLNGKYRVCGSLSAKHHILLGVTNKKEVLVVAYKANAAEEMKTFMEQNQDLFEKRFGEEEINDFFNLLKRNLGLVGMILGALFVLQLSRSQSSLLEIYVDEEMKEVALFYILGYNIKQVRGKIVSQYRWIHIMGGMAGYLCGEICMFLFGYLYCEPRGIFYLTWHISYILVPILLGILLFLLEYRKLYLKFNDVEWVKEVQN